MKRLKCWGMIMLMLMTMPVMTACGGDDSGNNNNNNAKPTITVNGKYLVKIGTTELVYNTQGQVIKVKNKNSQDIEYSYETKRIIVNNPDMIYYLDGGHVTECKYKVYTDIDNPVIVDANILYEYDASGNLIKEISSGFDYTESEPNPQTTVYEWHNGNITKITTKDSWNEHVEETTITYTSYANTIPNVSQGFIGDFLKWQGYFGNKGRNLPASETITIRSHGVPSDNIYTIMYNYEYTFDNGSVTKVTAKWNYDGYPSSREYELEWY